MFKRFRWWPLLLLCWALFPAMPAMAEKEEPLLTVFLEGGKDDLEIRKEMFPDPESGQLIEAWQRDLKLILGDFSAP